MEVNSLKKAYSSFQGWGMQYSMGEIPSYVYQFFKNGIESGSRYYSLGHSETRSIASFLNATYSYDGRYTLNGTFRYEGTNRMGRSVRHAGCPRGTCPVRGTCMRKLFSKCSNPLFPT